MKTMRSSRGSGRQSLALVLCIASATSGCSFLFVEAPPPVEQRRGNWTCTRSAVAPTLDVLGAGWFALNAAVNASRDGSDYSGGSDTRDAAIALGLSLVALEVASAATGFSRTTACREALGETDPPPRSTASSPWNAPNVGRTAWPPPTTSRTPASAPSTIAPTNLATPARPLPTASPATQPAAGPTSPASAMTPPSPQAPPAPVLQQRDDDDP